MRWYQGVALLLAINWCYTVEAEQWSLNSIKPKVDPVGGRIIGGYEVQPHAYPFAAALSIDYGAYFCAGSLISLNYVLTAAHCAVVMYTVDVILGAHNVKNASEATQVTITSTDIIVNPAYNTTSYNNDIALIKLPRPVSLNDAIQLAQLPSRTTRATNPDDVVVAIGWGLTEDVPIPSTQYLSPVLKAVNVTVMTVEDCSYIYNDQINYVTDKNICTSGYKMKGTCDGDSGGPLVTRDGILIGLTSFGDELCEACNPSAYTDISKFLDWIEENSDVIIK
ncbi:brachyurin-like [Cylas formicarius]|uniref:brachyurin-like n=1 Tax=Cylas formicarius TaxID=197179 RepID=UPI0029586CF5|nr:brachyurin-like [Cylas formicarius]